MPESEILAPSIAPGERVRPGATIDAMLATALVLALAQAPTEPVETPAQADARLTRHFWASLGVGGGGALVAGAGGLIVGLEYARDSSGTRTGPLAAGYLVIGVGSFLLVAGSAAAATHGTKRKKLRQAHPELLSFRLGRRAFAFDSMLALRF